MLRCCPALLCGTHTFRTLARVVVCVVGMWLGHGVVAQTGTQPTDCWQVWSTSTPPDTLLTMLRAQYKADLKALAMDDRRLRYAVARDWEDMHGDLLENLEENHFVFGTPMNALLDSIMQVLAAAVPDLALQPRVLLSWYPWPNASCRGEGTIVVNMGLLERLNDRSELAFVLAHEIAHQHLDHVRNAIEEVNAKLLSDDFQAELRDILRQEFNRVSQLEKLYISFAVGERRHGRNHEYEADAMAFQILSRTQFDPQAGVSLMDVLAACDEDPYPKRFDAQGAFIAGGADPEGDWMNEVEVSSLLGVDLRNRALEDSLKTHPDCEERKDVLTVSAGGWQALVPRQPDPAFLALRQQVARAIIESALLEEDLGRAVFVGMHRCAMDPADTYVHTALVRAFAGLCKHSKDHTMGDVLMHPSVHDGKDYARTLQMLHGMRRGDYHALATHHLNMARALDPQCEETLYAAVLLAYVDGSLVDLEQARTSYTATYPAGRHSEAVKGFTLLKTTK